MRERVYDYDEYSCCTFRYEGQGGVWRVGGNIGIDYVNTGKISLIIKFYSIFMFSHHCYLDSERESLSSNLSETLSKEHGYSTIHKLQGIRIIKHRYPITNQ